MAELTGQTFAGYEIIAKLGQGGMGAVFKARQPKLDRLAALKIMAQDLASDPDFVARFRREAAAAANLSHPNIVQVYSAGESEGTHYIAMEFVDGQTLKSHIDQRGRLDPREAIAITVYVAEALQYAWNKAKLIHRDIKPENIFLSTTGEVKVGDLGLAKVVGGQTTSLTQTGTAMGSPHYISPEQATGAKEIDFRTDLYSLGGTLYHMLTGQTPYSGDSSMVVMMKHVNDPPPAIFKVWPQCPMPLGLLVGKMLAKNRNSRPASYEELIEQLRGLHDKLKPATVPAAAPVSPSDPTQLLTPTPKPAPAPAQPTPKPAVTKTPKPETKARESKSVTRNSRLVIGAGALAAVALIAGAVWWFASGTGETAGGGKLLDLGGGVKMELVAIPPGEFMFGNNPPRKAAVRDRFWLGRTEVTVGQWKQFVAATGYQSSAEKKGYAHWCPQGPGKGTVGAGSKGTHWRTLNVGFPLQDNHPVACISWDDAMAFCEWLTERERKAGRLRAGYVLRLPTEVEWEYACRAGSTTKFWWGDDVNDGEGRVNWGGTEDAFEFMSPVDHFGERGRNPFGLADMLGNVAELCLDCFDAGAKGQLSGDIPLRATRGGSFAPGRHDCFTRNKNLRSEFPAGVDGFRVCLGPDVLGSAASAVSTTRPSSPVTPASDAALKLLGNVFTNAVGAEMVYIPPGEFMLGSNPPRKASIQEQFWLGRTEVTVGQWKQFVAATGYQTSAEKGTAVHTFDRATKKWDYLKDVSWRDPHFGFALTDDYPVCCMTWDDAVAFCEWLTERERKAGRLPAGHVIRLPIEAEWEYACRGGREGTKYWWGDSDEDGEGRLNWSGTADGFEFVSPADHYGARGRNGFGLADMLGNVHEWCFDTFDSTGAHSQFYHDARNKLRVLRGGNPMLDNRDAHQCDIRFGPPRLGVWGVYGFRVCLGPDVLGSTATTASDSSTGWQNAINLLPLIDLQKDVVEGTWTIQSGELLAADKNRARSRVEIPYRPPAEYDLRVTFTRQADKGFRGFPNLILAQSGRQFMWHSDMSDGHVFGFSLIDGLLPPKNNAWVKRPGGLENGHRYTYLMQVRNGQLKACLDDELMVQWSGEMNSLSLDPSCKLRSSDILGLLTGGCPVVFHKIELLEVTGKGTFTRGAPAATPSTPTLQHSTTPAPAADADWQNATNLLPLIDPQKDAVAGGWTVQNGELTSDVVNYSRIEIPYQSPDEYDFLIEFSVPVPKKDTGPVQLLSKAGREFRWQCFCRPYSNRPNSSAGFESVRGLNIREGPARTELGIRIETGKRYVSMVQVRNGVVRGYVNGKLCLEWKTDYADMDIDPQWKLRTAGLIGIGSQVPTTFHRIEIREVTGKGTFTRGAPTGPSNTPALQNSNTPATDAAWQNAINLLPLIDPQKDAAGGVWNWQGEKLVSDSAKNGRIAIPYRPPQEYDYRLVFHFTKGYTPEGAGQVIQILSKGGRLFSWIMGAKNGEFIAFETIAGANSADPANPTITRRNPALQKDVTYTSLVEVRNDGLKAYLNGELLAQWKTDYSDMGIVSHWKLSDPTLLGVGSWLTGLVIEKLEVREVTGKGTFTRSAPATASAPAADAWQNAINLLPLIDPAQDATSGKWEAVPDGLKATDIKNMSQKIQPPYRPPEEYDYRVSFTPISGNADVAIGLTAKGRSFVFYMKKYANDHCLGFEAISGKNIAGGPTAHRFPHLEMGSRYTVVVEVRKNGLRGYLDGKLVAEWATDYSDMSPWPVWRFKDDTLPGFGCSVSTVVFQEVKLREVSGKGAFTRPAP